MLSHRMNVIACSQAKKIANCFECQIWIFPGMGGILQKQNFPGIGWVVFA